GTTRAPAVRRRQARRRPRAREDARGNRGGARLLHLEAVLALVRAASALAETELDLGLVHHEGAAAVVPGADVHVQRAAAGPDGVGLHDDLVVTGPQGAAHV